MIQDKNYNIEEQNILTPIEFSHSDILLGEEKNAFTDSADDDKTNDSPFSSLGDMLDEASRMLNDALNEQMSRQRRKSQNGDAGSSTPFIEKFCTDMTVFFEKAHYSYHIYLHSSPNYYYLQSAHHQPPANHLLLCSRSFSSTSIAHTYGHHSVPMSPPKSCKSWCLPSLRSSTFLCHRQRWGGRFRLTTQ